MSCDQFHNSCDQFHNHVIIFTIHGLYIHMPGNINHFTCPFHVFSIQHAFNSREQFPVHFYLPDLVTLSTCFQLRHCFSPSRFKTQHPEKFKDQDARVCFHSYIYSFVTFDAVLSFVIHSVFYPLIHRVFI